jgi:nucleotide-binding universal stress UspA family protein
MVWILSYNFNTWGNRSAFIKVSWLQIVDSYHVEINMINHILVPLDGSALAECVLPHVVAIAPVTNARVTLAHVMEYEHIRGGSASVDPVEWHLRKHKLEKYLAQIAIDLQDFDLSVEYAILEGNPAESVIEFSRNNNVDLIALSTHGLSGLSGWNVSSVVQKILLRSYKSTLLIRAYNPANIISSEIRYQRVFVGLDCSPRAEYILPVAMNLARFYNSELIVGTVIQRPQTIQRLPLSESDEELIEQFVERNRQAASHYFEQLHTQFSQEGVELKTRIAVGNSVEASLHDMATDADVDLVILAAHGQSGERRWPYGSVATSFIAHGSTSLIIMQDLSSHEIEQTHAEQAVKEGKGH